MAATNEDRRVQRTRRAILDAFVSLFLDRRYEAIRIADVLERANVGRSTFYEHYRDKDALLAASIRRPFDALATAVERHGDPARLERVLEHFGQNRQQARSIFAGQARATVAGVLAEMIEARFVLRAREAGAPLTVSPRVAAIAVADALLGPIAAWVAGGVSCSVAELARALRAIAQGCAAAILGAPSIAEHT